MTASPSVYDESDHRPGSPLPAGVHLDSTAHIMNRISSQLASQLSLVSLDGRRRP
ncbi:sirohydrochlorin chelatase, partial [Streptomyces galilaeus]